MTAAAKPLGAVDDLHKAAMAKADEAWLLLAQARIAFNRASELEAEASRQWNHEDGREPTRSILTDSSTALAETAARCGRIK